MSKRFNIHDWQAKQRLNEMQSMDFGPNCPQYDSPEGEGKMAKGNAIELSHDAADVANMIGPNTNLPEWVESKITLAADYLNKVKDYLTHYEASRQKLHENIAVTPTFDETHEEFMARCEELGNSKDACMAMHGDHIFKQPTNEQGFDDRLKAAGGFSDEEFDDITSTDPNPFMDDDDPRSPGEELADRTIADFRKKYRGMSDDDLDDFSAKMVEHLLDNIAAQARAKVIFAKKGI